MGASDTPPGQWMRMQDRASLPPPSRTVVSNLSRRLVVQLLVRATRKSRPNLPCWKEQPNFDSSSRFTFAYVQELCSRAWQNFSRVISLWNWKFYYFMMTNKIGQNLLEGRYMFERFRTNVQGHMWKFLQNNLKLWIWYAIYICLNDI